MSAQEEFDQLVQNNRAHTSSHPEDRDDSPHFSDDNDSLSSPPRNLRQRRVIDSSDEDEDFDDNMVSSRGNYHVPNTVFEANTGPKGVIADAQAFERARKKSFRKTLLSAAGFDSNGPAFNKGTRDEPPAPAPEGSSGSEDDEERFMRKWRASRMQDYQNRGMRRPSPRGRSFGSVDTVDAAGYLDAIEKVTSDTVVVVCIYDPHSNDSAIVEECLVTIARRQPTTRFVKLHHEIAEMNHITAPALLAYRGGEVFTTITDIIRNIPKGRSCSADSLEDLLKLNRVV
ncbi:uncharacterized protein N7473_012283 [Penicillium subrubescens]|uniref:Phosducin-like protein n=1 Tax=Penicillium subrubescens TaxID=1316194 RepID=A0A1Q5UDU6_9EURO|nr:uncharacterized protein N7473_012283 [Penicillium subrubescens]KAJ5881230.1 hypothetical protein N7473_012283 [Penicillium subrubescens]OKP10650.1 Phosducin-like protein [Penicillium subrubescens]